MGKPLMETMTWGEITDKIMQESGLVSPKFKLWLMQREFLKGNFFSSMMWRHKYQIYQKLQSDGDHLETFTGKEGDGKSTLAMQCCAIIDPTFGVHQIFNKPTLLIKWLKANHGKTKGKALLIDEGSRFLLSRTTMSNQNIIMVKLLTLVRQANCYIALCHPQYEGIDLYLRKHRMSSLVRITVRHHCFTVYDDKAIKIINTALHKLVPWGQIKVPLDHQFQGSFNGSLPSCISDDSYRLDKGKAWLDFLDEAIQTLKVDPESGPAFVKVGEAVKITGLGDETIRRLIKSGELPASRLGSQYLIPRNALFSKGNKGLLAPGTPPYYTPQDAALKPENLREKLETNDNIELNMPFDTQSETSPASAQPIEEEEEDDNTIEEDEEGLPN
jgi:excisionase family DNA binding protein